MAEISYNYVSEQDKIKEIENVLQNAIKDYCDSPEELASFILEKCLHTSPPEKEPYVMHYITISSLDDGLGAKSVKPGNIRLNIKILLEEISPFTLAMPTVADYPWLIPFACLYLWNLLWKSSSIQLEKIDAGIIYTMWKNCDEFREINKQSAIELYNNNRNEYKLPEITQQDFDRSIKRLEDLTVIETSPKRPQNWWLREWIKTTYK